jgi:hypothetical protein
MFENLFKRKPPVIEKHPLSPAEVQKAKNSGKIKGDPVIEFE